MEENIPSELENIETYEVALAESPAQEPFENGSFLLLKEQDRGENSMPDETSEETGNEETQEEEVQETEKTFKDLIGEALDKKEDVMDEDTVDELIETMAEKTDKAPDEVWENLFDELVPEEMKKETEEEEEEETEKALSPKAKNAVKNVLEKLNEVRSQIPAQHQWVFSALAKMAGYPSPYGQGQYGYPHYTKYEYPKMAEKEVEEETKEAVEEGLKILEKIDELPEEGGWVKDALNQLTKEEEEMDKNISDLVDKEVQPMIKDLQEELEKKEERVTKLEKEKLEKEFIEKAESYENLPIDKDELVDTFKELHGSEAFETFIDVLSRLEKEIDTAEIFKSKGETGSDVNEPSSAIDKIEKEAEKLMEKEDLEKHDAMTEVFQNNEDLREKYAEERGVK